MQHTLYTASSSHLQWKPQKAHLSTALISKPIKLKSNTFKPFALSDSLKPSFNFEFEENKLEIPTTPARLPVVIRQPGCVSRYIWDGNDLNLISVDGSVSSLSSSCFDFEHGFRRLFRVGLTAIRNFFLPREVSENYLQYVKWKLLHRVFSSALQVLATQAMFRAIGIGYAHSLPSAAALNWVLKDGLGRLSRCVYTASLASAFDTNLKRVRFSTSVLFTLSIGVELLTPAFPQYFLLFASLANIAKQISLACYLATNTAVHRSFAMADNLGEVSAKAQIQTVCFDNLGLVLTVVLNIWLKSNQRLQAGFPFVVYPIFSAIDLFAIYQCLKHVHLQTLTKDRLEIIINTWIHFGYVPSPAEVSKTEGIALSWSKDRELWPVRIGCLNPKTLMPKLSMLMMQSLNDEDFYFLSMETFYGGLARTFQQRILLCLRERAGTADVVMGLLQACYVRRELLYNKNRWKNTLDSSDLFLRDWLKLIEDSKKSAGTDFKPLNEQMLQLGWASKNILLSTQEQARYSFLND